MLLHLKCVTTRLITVECSTVMYQTNFSPIFRLGVLQTAMLWAKVKRVFSALGFLTHCVFGLERPLQGSTALD